MHNGNHLRRISCKRRTGSDLRILRSLKYDGKRKLRDQLNVLATVQMRKATRKKEKSHTMRETFPGVFSGYRP